MDYKESKKPKESKDSFTVKATDNFNGRRLISIDGLSKEDYRALQAGQAIIISKSLFDQYPDLFEKEADNGNSIL